MEITGENLQVVVAQPLALVESHYNTHTVIVRTSSQICDFL
jgi:hypothetical protein